MNEEDFTDGLCERGRPMPKNASGAWWHDEARLKNGEWHCPVCGERWRDTSSHISQGESGRCQTDFCEASRKDGIICADDECDIASGFRTPAASERPAPSDPIERSDTRIIHDLMQTYQVSGDEAFHTAARRLQQLVSQVEDAQKRLKPIADDMRNAARIRMQNPVHIVHNDQFADAYKRIAGSLDSICRSLTSTDGAAK